MKIRVKEAHPKGAFPLTSSSSFTEGFVGLGSRGNLDLWEFLGTSKL
jgi:hypothetical protein